MAKIVNYIKHDVGAYDDLKIRAMRKIYGWQGYGWYWYFIETMRNSNNGQLEYGDFTFNAIADAIQIEPNNVKTFIDDCINTFHLFKLNGNNHFFSQRLVNDIFSIEDVKAKRRLAGLASAKSRQVELPITPPTNVEQVLNKCSTSVEQVLNPNESGHVQTNERLLNKCSTSVEQNPYINRYIDRINKYKDIDNKDFAKIVSLYENNIGTLSPMVSDNLKDILQNYPSEWFEKAVKEAVLHNARNLAYISAVLKSWKEKGIAESDKKQSNTEVTGVRIET